MASETEELAQLLREAQAEFQAALDGITERELRTPPAANEWSVAQIIGHVGEHQVFWVRRGQLMAALEMPDLDRTHDELEARSQAADKAKDIPWPELQRQLAEACRQALERLGRLREQAALGGRRNPTP